MKIHTNILMHILSTLLTTMCTKIRTIILESLRGGCGWSSLGHSCQGPPNTWRAILWRSGATPQVPSPLIWEEKSSHVWPARDPQGFVFQHHGGLQPPGLSVAKSLAGSERNSTPLDSHCRGLFRVRPAVLPLLLDTSCTYDTHHPQGCYSLLLICL